MTTTFREMDSRDYDQMIALWKSSRGQAYRELFFLDYNGTYTPRLV